LHILEIKLQKTKLKHWPKLECERQRNTKHKAPPATTQTLFTVKLNTFDTVSGGG